MFESGRSGSWTFDDIRRPYCITHLAGTEIDIIAKSQAQKVLRGFLRLDDIARDTKDWFQTF